MRSRRFDVLVVGAGPAGLAAALAAAGDGAHVGVVDSAARPGGQIWRATRARTAPQAAQLAARASELGADFLSATQVFDARGPHELLAEDTEGALCLEATRVVLALGATERCLPFPGWTLPGVCAAGGLQALVKGGLQIEGQRVVVAGSGPLLMAVAAYLRARGARVLGLFEQAPRAALAGFAFELLRHPRKAVQALELCASLQGVPQHFGAWPLCAQGDGRLQRLTLQVDGEQRTLELDWLACGFGLAPVTGLAALLGCELDGGRVRVDALQATSVAGVYCAGEAVGIGGVDCALVEGELAGHAAAGRQDRARDLCAARDRERDLARALEHAFSLRDELRGLVQPDTLVCRCEDVPWSALVARDDVRDAKLMTRCGMGACQARVCGAALEFLKGWPRDRVRPPLFPVTFGTLATVGAPHPD